MHPIGWTADVPCSTNLGLAQMRCARCGSRRPELLYRVHEPHSLSDQALVTEGPLEHTFPASTSASRPRAVAELPNRRSSAEWTFDRISWSLRAMRDWAVSWNAGDPATLQCAQCNPRLECELC